MQEQYLSKIVILYEKMTPFGGEDQELKKKLLAEKAKTQEVSFPLRHKENNQRKGEKNCSKNLKF